MGLVFNILFKGDTTDVDSAFKRLGDKAQKFASDIKSTFVKGLIGAAGIQSFESLLDSTSEYIKNIKHAEHQTDLTAEEIQRLTMAAKRAGLEFDDVAVALSHFGAARKEAGLHDGEMRNTLTGMGVSLEDIQDPLKTNLDLIKQYFAALKQFDTLDSEQKQFLREMFGRSGDRLGSVFASLPSMDKRSVLSQTEVDAYAEDLKKYGEIKDTMHKAWIATVVAATQVPSNFQGEISSDLVEPEKDEDREWSTGNHSITKAEANKPHQYSEQEVDAILKAGGQPRDKNYKDKKKIFSTAGDTQEQQEAIRNTKAILELYEQINVVNQKGNGTFDTRSERLKEIRTLLESADRSVFGDADESLTHKVSRAQLQMQAVTKMKALRLEEDGHLKLNVNSLQGVGAKIGGGAWNEMSKAAKESLSVEKQILKKIQDFTGQTGPLDSYQ